MGHFVGDAAEPLVRGVDKGHRAAFRYGTFRRHHNAEMTALGFAPPDLVADLVDIERDLGNQNDVCRAGDPRVERNEPRIAAHDFDHHHALVALRRRVHLVDRVGRGSDGGIESERRHGSAHVVVDRLGHADNREALFEQAQDDAERALAADRNQGVETIRAEGVEQLLRAVALLP